MPSSVHDPIQGPPSNQTASHGNVGGAAFNIDISEVLKFAFDLKGEKAPNIVRKELTTAMKKAIEHARTKANARITKRSGKAQNSAQTKTSVTSTGIVGTVTWTARSDKGFPYPIVLESGHKEIVPIRASALKFKGRDGKWVTTQKVKAWPGIQFASKGLQAAEGLIAVEFQAANARIVRQVEAL